MRLDPGELAPREESGLDLRQDPERVFGDPVVRRRDGAPAYHLASIVDDERAGVTRVVRGRDLAASTALQLALRRLLGLAEPVHRHHLLLLEERGGKLAKLHGCSGHRSAARPLRTAGAVRLPGARRGAQPGRAARLAGGAAAGLFVVSGRRGGSRGALGAAPPRFDRLGVMKVFLSVDMEGISGLVRWQDVIREGMDYLRNRRLMTQDANAAIGGAFEGGASEVVVEENHGVEDLCDLVLDEIDPRCRVVRGAGRPTATTMAALDAEVGVVLLVGHHARAGSFPGIMAHTVSYDRVQRRARRRPRLRRAGDLRDPRGRARRAGRARERRPGGDRAAPQARPRGRGGGGEARALERGGRRDPAGPSARGDPRRCAPAVERAKAGELAPYRGEPAPYEIEVELRKPPGEHLRENLARLPEFELVGERTLRTLAPDMDLGFRRIAYLGYGNRPGTLRY